MSIASALDGVGHDPLLATIAALLALSVVAAIAPTFRWNPRPLSLALSALACGGVLALGVIALAGGRPVAASAGDVLGFALIHVRYDALAGVFLVALGAVGAASSVFGIGYEPHGAPASIGPRPPTRSSWRASSSSSARTMPSRSCSPGSSWR